jgi:hypothetical protein
MRLARSDIGFASFQAIAESFDIMRFSFEGAELLRHHSRNPSAMVNGGTTKSSRIDSRGGFFYTETNYFERRWGSPDKRRIWADDPYLDYLRVGFFIALHLRADGRTGETRNDLHR